MAQVIRNQPWMGRMRAERPKVVLLGSAVRLMFPAVFLMRLVPLSGLRRDLSALWVGGWPRVLGIGLLIVVLLAV